MSHMLQPEPGKSSSSVLAVARGVPRSARRALQVLELFSIEPALRVSEIGDRLGIHKSKASRLVAALVAEGFLRRLEIGAYCLTHKLYLIGSSFPQHHPLLESARFELYQLRIETGESVHLSVLMGTEVVHLERVHSDHLIKHALNHSRTPTHATGAGKLLLAHAPNEICDRVIAHGLQRYTARTVTNPDALKRELATIRSRGFAINGGEFNRGISAVAAPIFDRRGQALGTIAVVAPSNILHGSRMDYALRALQRSTMRISQHLA